MIRRIAGRGHEIACHSYAHQLIYSLTPDEFREDTKRAVDAIGNAVGFQPTSYRAPSFSITNQSLWALEILIECGFRYDSSIFPIAHDRYGIPGFTRHAQALQTPSGSIFEVPVATTDLSGTIVPVGGGRDTCVCFPIAISPPVSAARQQEREPARPASISIHGRWMSANRESPRVSSRKCALIPESRE